MLPKRPAWQRPPCRPRYETGHQASTSRLLHASVDGILNILVIGSIDDQGHFVAQSTPPDCGARNAESAVIPFDFRLPAVIVDEQGLFVQFRLAIGRGGS